MGKTVRFRRLLNSTTGRMHIVPIDHGGYMGPVKGIENMKSLLPKVVSAGVNALLLQRGVIKKCSHDILGRVGLIMRISGTNTIGPSTPFEEITTSCEEAIRLGVDAVAFTTYVGLENDSRAFKIFGKVVDECDDWGIPVLGEFLPAAGKISNPYDVKWIKTAARIGAELGADFIKTYYGEPFEEVVDTCPVPIVIAGGEKMDDPVKVLTIAKKAVKAGAIGVCIGRNVFQYEDPVKMASALSKIVHEGITVEEAVKILGSR